MPTEAITPQSKSTIDWLHSEFEAKAIDCINLISFTYRCYWAILFPTAVLLNRLFFCSPLRMRNIILFSAHIWTNLRGEIDICSHKNKRNSTNPNKIVEQKQKEKKINLNERWYKHFNWITENSPKTSFNRFSLDVMRLAHIRLFAIKETNAKVPIRLPNKNSPPVQLHVLLAIGLCW